MSKMALIESKTGQTSCKYTLSPTPRVTTGEAGFIRALVIAETDLATNQCRDPQIARNHVLCHSHRGKYEGRYPLQARGVFGGQPPLKES